MKFAEYRVRVSAVTSSDADIDRLSEVLEEVGLFDKLNMVVDQVLFDARVKLGADFPDLRIEVQE